MSKKDSTPRREWRRLNDLKPHPLQSAYFDELSDSDLQDLAGDIAANGLRHPIEILARNRAGLPANTILAGHQRRRALLLNGETEAEVLVRYDLTNVDAQVIEREFLS